MISTKNDYDCTYGVVRQLLQSAQPQNRNQEKTILFVFRYGAAWDHKAVEDALADYHKERKNADAG